MRGLRKTYRAERHGGAALDGVDLDVEDGAFATVLGPSGSGKTTLLRCIAGFEAPDAGTITLDGRTVARPPGPGVRPYDRGVGVVPQEGALFPHLSVARNIAFGISGRPRAWRRERVEELIALVGLHGLRERRPHQLSGGQQQRVALARALAPGPRLVLLDEPFSALDAQLRVELREEVREVLRTVGATALLVTHDQAEAMTLADHLVVMRSGRVVAAGDPREVYESPVDAELGRFLGEAVVLPGVLERASGVPLVRCALGRLEVARGAGTPGPCPNEACDVLVRPEQLVVRRAGEAPSAAGAVVASRGVTGRVDAQQFYGHDALLRVRLDGGQDVAVRVDGWRRFGVGDAVEVDVETPVRAYAGPAGRSPEEPHG